MRVKRHDERGATIVITVLAMVALMGAAAFAIDLGNGWQTRRHLVTTTDAAALAAAQEYVLGGNGCTNVAGTYVSDNFVDANMVSCLTASGSSSSSGAVAVTADANVTAFFSPVLGLGDFPAQSSTTVEWGTPSAVSDLRPFGLCYEGSTAFAVWVLNPTSTATITIPYGKDDNPEACNGGEDVPGNWAVMDYNGGANPQGETNDWTRYGYKDLVTAGTLGGGCVAEAYACYEGNTGAFNNPLSSHLAYLRDNNITFQLPVFDSVNGLPGGNNEFHIIYFVTVEVEGFKVNGPVDGRYLTLKFQPGLAQGTCCDNSGPDTGVKVIEVCAIDETDPNGCP